MLATPDARAPTDSPEAGDDIKTTIDERVRGYVSPEVQGHIKKASNTLAASIDALQRLFDRKGAFTEQLKALEKGEFPSGVRPFSVSYETPHLDNMHTSIDEVLTIDLANLSFRDAKRKLYAEYLEAQKRLDLQIFG